MTRPRREDLYPRIWLSASMQSVTCPRCGFANPSDFRFCGKCGKRIPTSQERGRAVSLCHELSHSLGNHVANWAGKPAQQRAALRAGFEKHTGMSPAEASMRMQKLEGHLRGREFREIEHLGAPVKQLASYFNHACMHLREVEGDPKRRREAEKEMVHCAETAIDLAGLLTNILG